MNQMEEHDFYSGLLIKIGAKCFFCSQEGHFRINYPLFSEALKNQNHPKHNLALVAVQDTRNRQNEVQNKDIVKDELSTKMVKAVTEEKQAEGVETRGTLEKTTGRCNKQSET